VCVVSKDIYLNRFRDILLVKTQNVRYGDSLAKGDLLYVRHGVEVVHLFSFLDS
jgi:hypothetical protein